MNKNIAPRGNIHTQIGVKNNVPVYFDNEADGIYDYIDDGGYSNLGDWIKKLAKKHNK